MKAFNNIVRGNSRLEVRSEKDAYELILIGPVGGSWFSDDGIKESEVRDALKSIPKGRKINVHINSEGGSVQEGLGIYNAFRARSKDITAYVDGYALSIASVFPLAAGKVVSPKSAIWMIHKAWADVRGNDTDMDRAAEMLRAHNDTMAEIYAEHTGKTPEEMLAAMDKETWIKGSAAVDFGLADEGDEEDASASAYRPLPAGYLTKCKKSSEAMAMFGIKGSNIPGELDRASNLAWQNKVLNFSNAILNTQFTPASGNQEGSADNKTKPAGAPGGAIKNHMEKIKALLKKHGIQVAEDATEDQLMAALENIPTTKTDNADKSGKTVILDATLSAQITAMQNQLEAEKKARITARVESYIVNLRLTNDEKDDAIKRSMADESYLEIIAKRPQVNIGGDSVTWTGGSVSAVDPILDLKEKYPVAAKRYEVQVADWEKIMLQACRKDARAGLVKDPIFVALASAGILPFSNRNCQLPVAANTITNVLTNFLMDGSVTNLQNMWAMLAAFSLDTRPDGYKPLAPGILKHITASSAGQTNATNYETSGDTTIAPVTITPAEHSKSYQISNTDLNSGVRMADLVTLNTAVFADLVITAAVAPITVGNFGAATVVRQADLFSFTDLATLQAALRKSPIKNLILDGAYIARISNLPTFFQVAGTVAGASTNGGAAWRGFGWNWVAQNTNWTGAGPNVQGFACNPQAIGGIIGLPLLPAIIPGNILASEVLTVPGLDIQVLAEAWFNPATRISWNSLRVMDGWNAVDTTAGFLITSA